MVIGHGKDKFINNEPILKFYLNHFEEVLNEDEEKQLFIIGYSFQDEHINQIISKAKKTKLFILNTSPMKDFFDELETRSFGKKIIEKIFRYYPRNFSDLASNVTSSSHENLGELYWSDIENTFLKSNL